MDQSHPSSRPRIALLGEFSAGKSTLLNLLLKGAHSPVRVTATQLPPIWYSHGTGPAVHIARDGTETELPGGDLSQAPLGDTRAIRVQVQADILTRCDLLDMPGSSDPNMTPDIWDALLPEANGVLWCSPSTQAWRQSEAAIWEEVPEALHTKSLLLLTRIDKIRRAEDRQRLLARVRRETRELFRSVEPVALLEAQEGLRDGQAWADSGMASVMTGLDGILAELGGKAPVRQAAAVLHMPAAADAAAAASAAPSQPETGERPAIMPRRVARRDGPSARSRRVSGEGSLI